MQFHSTPESTLNLKITKLAIIETALSVALYVSIGLYFGTFRYLALAVLVAPLMLLRTQISGEWGLKIYLRYHDFTDEQDERGLYLVPIMFLFGTPLVGIGIRVISTVYWALRKPLLTLSEIPQNWLRQSFCIDFFHPPEIIPLEATKGGDGIFTFSFIIEVFRREAQIGGKVLILIMMSPFLIIGYIPSLIYRVSFKATSIVYAPFVWVAQATLRNPLPIKERLERITKGELEKVRRWISLIILTTLVAKIALVLGWVDLSYVAARFPSQRLMETFVAPGSWPLWQITLVSDAVLTFFLLYFADAALVRLTGNGAWQEKTVAGVVSIASLIRGVLGIFTISHGFYLSLIEVGFLR